MPRSLRRWLALMVLMLIAVLPTVAAAADVPPPPPKEPNPPSVKVSREQAIAIVTSLFPVPDDAPQPSSYLDATAWRLYWNPVGGSMNQSAAVDAMTGEILSVDRFGSRLASGPIAVSRGEALAKATALVAKLAGEHRDELLPPTPAVTSFPAYPGDGYVFTWQRAIYGRPVQGDGLTVQIDPRSSEVLSFNRVWRPNVTLTVPEALLTPTEAVATYRKQVPLQLRYVSQSQSPGAPDLMRLVYVPATSVFPYLTHDDQLLALNGDPLDASGPGEAAYPVPAAGTPYQRPAQRLTADQALALAKQVAGRSDDPQSMPGKGNPDDPNRLLTFTWPSDGKASVKVYVTIDTDLGVVTGYSNWSQSDQQSDQPSDPAGDRATALAFLQTARPDFAGSALLVESTGPKAAPPSPYHNFSVYLTRNGVRVDPQVGYLSLVGGTVQNFNVSQPFDLEKAVFPSLADVLTPQAAYDRFFGAVALAQQWVGPNDDAAEHPLTYVWGVTGPFQMASIDARTGAVLNANGRNLVDWLNGPTDVTGHFAEREIRVLWANWNFQSDGPAFRPDQPATLADIVTWLALIRPTYYYPGPNFDLKHYFDTPALRALGDRLAAGPAAPQLTALLNQGAIKPADLDPGTTWESPVSRELFALWAVRTMNYTQVVTMSNRIDLHYADAAEIGATFANAVGFLQGTGIMRGDGVNFAPKRSVNRGEAVKVLFALPAPDLYFIK